MTLFSYQEVERTVVELHVTRPDRDGILIFLVPLCRFILTGRLREWMEDMKQVETSPAAFVATKANILKPKPDLSRLNQAVLLAEANPSISTALAQQNVENLT